MASVDKELEEELVEAGEKLLDPPSSVNDLITVLIVSTLLFFFSFHFFKFMRFLRVYFSLYLSFLRFLFCVFRSWSFFARVL